MDTGDWKPGNSKLMLQEYLFNSLLYDVSFHTNILNIISIGPAVPGIQPKKAEKWKRICRADYSRLLS